MSDAVDRGGTTSRRTGLPTPWLGGSPEIGLPVLLAGLDPADQEDAELATALRYAEARVQDYRSELLRRRLPEHVLLGQAVLDLAVEWRMPQVERWAVAWLTASGLPFLRTRWSSRSRNGRQRRERQLREGTVSALVGYNGAALIGTTTGAVSTWAVDGTIAELPSLLVGGRVLTVAGRDGRIVAGGPNGAFAASGWPPGAGPPAPERRSGIVAIATDGEAICLGQESGRIALWRPGDGGWTPLPRRASPVRAIGLDRGTVRLVWADGVLAVWAGGAGWAAEQQLGGRVAAAAFDRPGRQAAYAIEGRPEVRLAGRAEPLWTHGRRITGLTWSPDGLLASAGRDGTLRAGVPGTAPVVVNVEGDPGAPAFAGERHLITATGDRLCQWDLDLAGSDDPTFGSADRITAVAFDPADEGYSVVGTETGHLQRYDARGLFADWQPATVGGQVRQIVRHGEGWLVAAYTGAWQWQPGERPVRLETGFCQAVTSWRGHAVLAVADEVVIPEQGWRETLPSTVTGLAADGETLAVLARDGTLLRRDESGTTRGTTTDDMLLAVSGGAVLTVDTTAMLVRERRAGRVTARLRLTVKPSRLVPLDGDRYAGVYAAGTAVIEPEAADADPPSASVVAALPVGAEVIAAGAGRVVTAAGLRLTGYDVVVPHAATSGSGTVALRPSVDGACCAVTVGERAEPVRLPLADLAKLVVLAGKKRVDQQTQAVDLAGRLGDQLWSGGLDVELDRARGDDPGRPVRLDLRIRAEDQAELADVPWELLHPRTGPLAWFDDPPVSMVRLVAPEVPTAAEPVAPRRRMLVLRDADDALNPVTEAYEELRRRTRRVAVTLLHGTPLRANGLADLREPADVVHLWAHAEPDVVRLNGVGLPNDQVAAALAETGARLIVLVGCSSSALARRLVRLGVEAVVGMRIAVYNTTVHTLVEEVTTATLRGVPVDRAFTVALRRYVLSGQPAAAGVPLLYLREGSTGAVFPAAS
ncbi:CHAT domain-containing protein [Actinoplanes sp. NPDC048967]|uniref:CHAT domain-containing protein n=1 Tax=Actinoplanes sp. NPDC048967 TaxID=3155269 RepID=UPI0033F06D7E